MIFLVVAIAVVGCAALALVAWRGAPTLDDSEEITLVERPTLLPGNANLVAILYTVADDIEVSGQRVAGGLRDIARVIQLVSTEPVATGYRGRIADFVHEHAGVLKRSGQRIREGA